MCITLSSEQRFFQNTALGYSGVITFLMVIVQRVQRHNHVRDPFVGTCVMLANPYEAPFESCRSLYIDVILLSLLA